MSGTFENNRKPVSSRICSPGNVRVTRLKPDTSYPVKVRAYDYSGNYSEPALLTFRTLADIRALFGVGDHGTNNAMTDLWSCRTLRSFDFKSKIKGSQPAATPQGYCRS